MKKIIMFLLLSPFLIGNDSLELILKSALNKKSQIHAYCRPNVYYRIEPNAAFLKRYGIKKVYSYLYYQSGIQEILNTDLSLQATDTKEYESSTMLLVIFNDRNNHIISIKREPLNIEDRILIDKSAYLIKQKKLAESLLNLFCPQIEDIFKQ